MVTSNHIHLLVIDSGPDVISKSLQLIAGRTAQEFNQRKERKGAFWEDRYHATAVDRDEHLIRCLLYIDLNMVRAGVVNHPTEWEVSGYNEIQNPPARYAVIDMPGLRSYCGIPTPEQFSEQYRQWVQEAIMNGTKQRESCWSESIAVGSVGYVEDIRTRLGVHGNGRVIEEQEFGRCVLREKSEPYNAVFDPKNERLRPENGYFWDIYST